jgi:hypothetical protein
MIEVGTGVGMNFQNYVGTSDQQKSRGGGESVNIKRKLLQRRLVKSYLPVLFVRIIVIMS